MTPRQRRWIFLVAGLGLLVFYLWGLSGLPGFGNYPGPYLSHATMRAIRVREKGDWRQ